MKTRLIFSVLALLFLPLFAQATHIVGGYISYSVDPQNPRKYNFTQTVYTNRNSTAEDMAILVAMGDGTTVEVPRATVVKYNNIFDLETFFWSYTYGSPGEYTVAWTGENRDNNHINIPSPSDQKSFYILTTLKVDPTAVNRHGAKLAGAPLFAAYVGEEMKFNLIAYDADGDRLTYDLVPSRERKIIDGKGYPTYIAGYTFPEGLTVDKFGELRWKTPATKGKYAIAVKITEHREGKVIGSMVVDFMVTVAERTQQPILRQLHRERLTVNYDGSILARPNQPLKLEYFLRSAEGTDFALHARQYSDLDTLDLASPVITMRDSANGKAVTLTFTPTADLVRLEPYTIGMRGKAEVDIRGNGSFIDRYDLDWNYTYLVVGEQQPTAVGDELAKAGFILYPNPVADKFVIKAPDLPNMLLHLRDVNGKTVARLKLQPGQNNLTRPEALAAGLYFYTITSRHKPVGTGKMLVK
ncbi:T9SS type A sorting domain-containing protein [Pontibacter akesuensis]|uniref:Por secretion system C-terminal sorting domain-containing protein n=1 Tax=Pontibacter akesuensis TaxID=388950 RepID=A0A1I7J9Q5_9BACT|nr:T9SS type A sorting domain-containing protein [Pontibacter akesuensis]GHA71588.1 hypothetical protein GCM10007389_26470 [Pontibacter akesuensis]SFU81841.1 Por secretion system C-terminal sorting domain-containing protein [Pontibacter akesuensis]